MHGGPHQNSNTPMVRVRVRVSVGVRIVDMVPAGTAPIVFGKCLLRTRSSHALHAAHLLLVSKGNRTTTHRCIFDSFFSLTGKRVGLFACIGFVFELDPCWRLSGLLSVAAYRLLVFECFLLRNIASVR